MRMNKRKCDLVKVVAWLLMVAASLAGAAEAWAQVAERRAAATLDRVGNAPAPDVLEIFTLCLGPEHIKMIPHKFDLRCFTDDGQFTGETPLCRCVQ